MPHPHRERFSVIARRGVLLVVLALCATACGGTANHSPKVARAPRHNTAGGTGHSGVGVGDTAATSPSAARPSTHVTVGIGDNKTEFLTDPRFLALGITDVRDDVPWDVLSEPYPSARLALWLREALAEHLTPLISFDHSGVPGRRRELPSVAEFSKLFLEFRARYPWVTEFVTWDEVNFFLQPTATDPQRVAGYYLALRRDCPSCTILAADLLDLPGPQYAVPMSEWVRGFMRNVPTQPAYWGLNNYVGANGLDTSTTLKFLRSVTGKVWFAETAGVISDGGRAVAATAARLERQATVDRFILGPLAGLSPRIQRVYLYEWNAQTTHDGWDSALVSSNGAPRPAYYALADILAAWGIKPDCAVSTAPPACSAASKASG
ncbi:MAG TPA: hypothetical protein VHM72_05235 [Solirubrobacteraceae bacterium]|nr:hypothetical protein [Solirubrobacteraceae bacterium]